ncbi:hypothetical protein CK203_044640 [Vitis vinifera]|uniref:Uncharacterized protein n=1 Tax=Vitis vinifera TaxID=29760 RepID=A0A438HJN2_VITVI|nr:hypothetical protein CK203_044640 [Vitis vinifera]
MPKTRGGSTSAPQSSQRAAPVRAPLDAPHIYLILPLRADTIRGEHLPRCGPYSDSTSGPPTKKAKTSEPGESSRAPRDSQSQPLPPGALDPACPLRATQIADQRLSCRGIF